MQRLGSQFGFVLAKAQTNSSLRTSIISESIWYLTNSLVAGHTRDAFWRNHHRQVQKNALKLHLGILNGRHLQVRKNTKSSQFSKRTHLRALFWRISLHGQVIEVWVILLQFESKPHVQFQTKLKKNVFHICLAKWIAQFRKIQNLKESNGKKPFWIERGHPDCTSVSNSAILDDLIYGVKVPLAHSQIYPFDSTIFSQKMEIRIGQ